MHRYRTHTCGALRSADVGATARLSGWVHRVRDHGGLVFIDLRDHYGLTQCVVDPDSAAFVAAETVRAEWVIRVDGEVKPRSADTVNPSLPTGEVEIFIREIEVLSEAEELPLPVFGEPDYPEETRLRYRFVDLRRETLHRNIVLRSKIITAIRRRMVEAGFTEYQTPILTASSPEGARDFLVPSRLHPGKFYALPQAPQQFKQLIMVAGFDRYFQIAPCFRDEDARADRSPGEFYQLDIEMSFVTQDDVFAAVEPVMRGLFEEFADGWSVTPEFPRIAYLDAMRRYGSDKPDLRNPIEMSFVSDRFRGSRFKLFARILEEASGGRDWTENAEVFAIPAPGGGSRAFCDRMNSWAQGEGQPGLGYIFFRNPKIDEVRRGIAGLEQLILQSHSRRQPWKASEYEEDKATAQKRLEELEEEQSRDPLAYIEAAGPIAANLGPERTEAIRDELDLVDGDAVFFVCGVPARLAAFAGQARDRIGAELGLTARDRFEFCWIVDYPMFEWNDEDKAIGFSHNPFSMPQGGLEALETGDPLDMLAYQYDLVCNGVELSSGAIRNHKPEIMEKAFGIAGYDTAVLEEKFGGMFRAFKLGAPPHGGIAPGIDRIVMLLAREENLREVTMFPMTQGAEDLMMGAPSEASARQLRELHIQVTKPDRKHT